MGGGTADCHGRGRSSLELVFLRVKQGPVKAERLRGPQLVDLHPDRQGRD